MTEIFTAKTVDEAKALAVKKFGKSEKENAFLFRICCGGGTYIRSIARDMAAALGTHAVMSSLRREQSGVFTLENSIPYALLEEDLPLEELEK